MITRVLNKCLTTMLLLTAMALSPAFAEININTASVSELAVLHGIGPGKAKAIVDYRTANGSFAEVEDLVRVKGIGKKTLDKLRDEITVGKKLPGMISGNPLNLNTATAKQLQSLPGIGAAKATAIVAARKSVGKFKSADDLVKVEGLSQKSVDNIRSMVTVK